MNKKKMMKGLWSAFFLSLSLMLICSCNGSDGDDEDSAPLPKTETAAQLLLGLATGSGYEASEYHYAWAGKPVRYDPPPLVRGEEIVHDPMRYDFEAWYFDAVVTDANYEPPGYDPSVTGDGLPPADPITVKLLYSREDLLKNDNPPVTRIQITRTMDTEIEQLETFASEIFYQEEDPYNQGRYMSLGEYYYDGRFWRRGDFLAETAVFDIRFGDSSRAYYDGSDYHVSMNHGDEAADLIFTPLQDGWKPGTGNVFHHYDKNKNKDYDLFFQIPIPYAKVSGTIRIDGDEYQVNGYGYMDHRWGNIHPLELYRGRYMARFYSEDFTAFWLLDKCRLDGKSIENSSYLFITDLKTNKHLLSTESFNITLDDYVLDQNLLVEYPTYSFARFIDEDKNVDFRLEVPADELLERFDPLEFSNLPIALQEAVRKYATSPAQFRHKGDAQLYLRMDDQEYYLSGDAYFDSLFIF